MSKGDLSAVRREMLRRGGTGEGSLTDGGEKVAGIVLGSRIEQRGTALADDGEPNGAWKSGQAETAASERDVAPRLLFHVCHQRGELDLHPRHLRGESRIRLRLREGSGAEKGLQ